jgi:hypothetical protein
MTKILNKKTVWGVVMTLVMGVMLMPGFVFAVPPVAADADAGEDLDLSAFGVSYASTTGLGTTDIRSTIGSIINVSLSLLGIVSLVIILYAGFEWMTAGGNDEQVGSARKRMIAGVIGLAIILSSYALSSFILKQLATATGYTPVEAEV